MYSGKFKKFGGDKIDNIVDYLMEIYEREPTITIAIGNDSVQKRRKTMYANTIVIYNRTIKNGAHVVFYRESTPKIYDTFTRLYKEAEYMNDLGNWLDEELNKAGFVRKDIDILERKRYKFMIQKERGDHAHVPLHYQDDLINNMVLNDEELNFEYRSIDVHLDFNPFEHGIGFRNKLKYNKSNKAYSSAIPWIRGQGFRTFVKPMAYASTSAADLLLK